MTENRRNITYFAFYIVVIFIISGIDLLPEHVLSHANALMIQYAVYCVLIIWWAVRAQNRLYHTGIRRMHVWLVFFFFLMIFLSRLRRVVFAGVYPQEHLLWYLFYVPDLAISLLSYYMSLHAGKNDDYQIPKRKLLWWIPFLIINLFVFTNERHQLAFVLSERGTAVSIAGRYQVSYVYLIAQFWLFGFALAAIIHLYRVLRANDLRAYILPPAVMMTAGFLYTVLYAIDRSPAGFGYIEPNCMTIFSTIGLWEACIVVRLIPSNSNYDAYFNASTVPMAVMDDAGAVRFSSHTYRNTRDNCLPSVEHSTDDTDGMVRDTSGKEYRIQTYGIPGGSIRWYEDVTQLQHVIRELEEGEEKLRVSNEQIAAQTRMKLQTKEAEERARYYDEALRQTGGRMELLRSLLNACEKKLPETDDRVSAGDEAVRQETSGRTDHTDNTDTHNDLAQISVLGAYVKRRSNLVLLSAKEDMLPLAELHFCLRESTEAMLLTGVRVDYTFHADEAKKISAAEMMRIYDDFERTLETEYLKLPVKNDKSGSKEEAGTALSVTLEEINGAVLLRMRPAPHTENGGSKDTDGSSTEICFQIPLTEGRA